jgi:4-hydroxy-3-methylbut-2-enyl diphosphate reductase
VTAPWARPPYPGVMSVDVSLGMVGRRDDGTSKRVLLAEPRGYCAGVDRAVETVEQALAQHGAPIYVRKEIVHNKHVVQTRCGPRPTSGACTASTRRVRW